MTQGFHVDIDELRDSSARVQRAVEDTGLSQLDQVDRNPGKYGNEHAARAVSDFCRSAREAITRMTDVARSSGRSLSESADHYTAIDDQVRANLEQCSDHR